MVDYSRYFKENLSETSPTTKEEIQRTEAYFGVGFPDGYKAFLLYSNGYEGWVGSSYVNLWKAEELIESNQAYQVAEFCPQLIIIGSDGGGEAFGLDTRSKSITFVAIPFIVMMWEDARFAGVTFEEFLDYLDQRLKE